MRDKAFETIAIFCQENDLSTLHQRILLHKYYEDYYTLVNDHKDKEDADPSADIIKGFKATLLNEMTLKTNLKLAEDEIKSHTEKEVRKAKRSQSNKSFWLSVLSSVIGSIVFTLLLILFFYMAQTQVKSWINDIYNDNKEIQQTVNGENEDKKE